MNARWIAVGAGLSLVLCLEAVTWAQPGAISSVVVYADRAQVTRSQTVDCSTGQAVFRELPSTIDTKTLQATLGGAGAVLGVAHREEATGPRPQAEVLQLQIRKLDEQLADCQSEIEAARASERKLLGFGGHLQRVWALQATGKTPPTASWEAALDLLRQQALQAGRKQQAAEARRRELQRQRVDLHGDLQRVEHARRRTTYQVTAFLRCSGKQRVDLSYVVPAATWRVAYQARADAKDPRQVTLVAQAIVQQGTGEEWRDVRLAVSTASLQRDNLPPRLQRLRVSGYKPQSTQKVLERRFEQREHLRTISGEPEDRDGVSDDTKSADTAAGVYSYLRKTKVVRRGAAEPGVAMQLEAIGKTTVAADGREVLITLARQSQTAAAALDTVPKLYPFVYRRLTLHNPFPFTLLAGPMAIYRGPAFIGTAQIKTCASREPFDLSLGVDHDLRVERFVKAERLEGPGVFGSKKRLRHRYVLEVGNWTPQAQRVRVMENIPVPQVREIEVSLDDDSSAPTAWHKVDGLLTWEVSLPARSKRSLVLAYTITLPAAYEVSGY